MSPIGKTKKGADFFFKRCIKFALKRRQNALPLTEPRKKGQTFPVFFTPVSQVGGFIRFLRRSTLLMGRVHCTELSTKTSHQDASPIFTRKLTIFSQIFTSKLTIFCQIFLQTDNILLNIQLQADNI